MSSTEAIVTAWIRLALETRGLQGDVNSTLDNIDVSRASRNISTGISQGVSPNNPQIAQSTTALNQNITQAVADAGDAGTAGFSKKFEKGMLFASAGIIAGAASAVKGLYEIGDTWDGVEDTIRVGTGATGEALEGMVEGVENVLGSIPTTADVAASYMSDLNTRTGATGETLETLVSQFATLENLDSTLDVNNATQAMSAFGIEADGMSAALDETWRVSQATGVSMEDLMASAQKNATAMKSLGFSYGDTVSLLGSLNKAGLEGEKVIKGFEKSLVASARAGKNPQEELAKVTEGMQKLVAQGKDAEAAALGRDLFGTKNVVEVIGAMKEGSLNLKEISEQMGATDDTIIGLGQDTADAAETFQLLKNKMLIALKPLSETVFSAIGDTLNDLMPVVEKASAWAEKNTGTLKVLAITAGVVAAGILGITGAMLTYKGIMATVAGATKIWTAATMAFNAVMALNPVGIVILSIAALIAIGVALYKNWDTISAKASELWTGISEGFTGIWESITGFFSGIGEWLGSFLSDAWAKITGFFAMIGEFYITVYSTIFNTVMSVLTSIGSSIMGVFNTVTSTISNVWTSIASGWATVWGLVTTGATAIKDGLVGAFNAVKDAVVNVFKAIVSTIVNALNTPIIMVNGIIDAMNALKIDIPDFVPGIGGQTWGVNLPKFPTIPVPAMATGGDVTGPTLVLAGEKDPETIVNRGTANNLMESLTRRLESGGIGDSIVQGDITIRIESSDAYLDGLTTKVIDTSLRQHRRVVA